MREPGITAWLFRRAQLRSSSNRLVRFVGWGFWGLWMNALTLANPLGRLHPVGSLGRLWAWQVWRRSMRSAVAVELPDGSTLECPAWSSLAGSWISVGFHEYDEMMFLLDLTRPGDVVIDVGANLGIYSVIAAGRGARAIAFEPNAAVAAVLRRNLAMNGHKGSMVYELALSDTTGFASFGGPSDAEGRLQTDRHPGYRVEVRRLEDVLGAERPTLIKIDAEGFDPQVLAGAEMVLARDRPTVITEVFDGGIPTRRWLEGRGYRVYYYLPTDRRLEEFPMSFDRQGNFIAVHEDRIARVTVLLRTAQRPHLRQPRVHWRYGSR